MLTYILAGVCSLVFLVVDRITKINIENTLKLGESKEFLHGFLNIFYVHNNGGAWGILAGYTWVLLAVTAVIMLIGLMLLVCKGSKDPWLFWSISLILSGGIGNMYDRIFNNGMVIDFLQFDFWQSFPVFNVADCAIVLGCGVLIVYFILDTVRDTKRRKTT